MDPKPGSSKRCNLSHLGMLFFLSRFSTPKAIGLVTCIGSEELRYRDILSKTDQVDIFNLHFEKAMVDLFKREYVGKKSAQVKTGLKNIIYH